MVPSENLFCAVDVANSKKENRKKESFHITIFSLPFAACHLPFFG